MRRKLLAWLAASLALGAFVKAATTPLYDEKADARHDISAAVIEAGKSKKHVVLIFGANW
jgi:protein disulfide-isomerase